MNISTVISCQKYLFVCNPFTPVRNFIPSWSNTVAICCNVWSDGNRLPSDEFHCICAGCEPWHPVYLFCLTCLSNGSGPALKTEHINTASTNPCFKWNWVNCPLKLELEFWWIHSLWFAFFDWSWHLSFEASAFDSCLWLVRYRPTCWITFVMLELECCFDHVNGIRVVCFIATRKILGFYISVVNSSRLDALSEGWDSVSPQ